MLPYLVLIFLSFMLDAGLMLTGSSSLVARSRSYPTGGEEGRRMASKKNSANQTLSEELCMFREFSKSIGVEKMMP